MHSRAREHSPARVGHPLDGDDDRHVPAVYGALATGAAAGCVVVVALLLLVVVGGGAEKVGQTFC